MARDLSIQDISHLYSLSMRRVAQLFDTTEQNLYQHLKDDDGNQVTAEQSKKLPGRVWLVWYGRRIPADRDHNGNLRFSGPVVAALFAPDDDRRQHPSMGPGA